MFYAIRLLKMTLKNIIKGDFKFNNISGTLIFNSTK